MPKQPPRQRPIPVTADERRRLDEAKSRYERTTGDEGDWGRFLSTVTLLGLAAAGVYSLAKALSKTEQSVTVCCPTCGKDFLMAFQIGADRAILTICPSCSADLVVYRVN